MIEFNISHKKVKKNCRWTIFLFSQVVVYPFSINTACTNYYKTKKNPCDF